MTSISMLAIVSACSWLGDGPPAAAHRPQGNQGPRPVRVMSYNIRNAAAPDGKNAWPLRKDFLVETITSFDPDLLGTQETLAVQRDDLARALKGYEVFAVGRDDGREAGEMAALFFRSDRFERLSGGHFWLSETPDRPGSRGWDAALPRIASWVKLKDRAAPDGPPLLFLNTHFDHVGTKARIESARLIGRKFRELGEGCRIIITGDFNSPEASGPYSALFGKGDRGPSPVVDTFRAARPSRGDDEGTFTGFRARRARGGRIDWIACSRDWEVRQAGIDRTARDGRTPSDHYPVTAVLRPTIPGHAPTLRVLCFNIHHGEGTDGKVDLPRLARAIRAADPDLVALQEVDNRTKRTGRVDQTSELARLTGLIGRFGKQLDYDGGEYGQAVLSRFPIEAGSVHILPGEPDRERRIAFEVRVLADGASIRFVTTHLHHINDNFRERQASRLNELYADGDGPVILAGDLNATPESEPIARLREAWKLTSGEHALPTFPSPQPSKTIDYIMIRRPGNLHPASLRVLDEPIASDHRPVLAIFDHTSAGDPR